MLYEVITAGMEFSAFFINTTLGFGGLNDFAQKYVRNNFV